MFPLHESTQRRLCRALFVGCCAIPTLLVAVLAVWLRTPAYRAAQAEGFSAAAGVRVSLDRLIHPRPGQTRLTNVAVYDPETGRLWAEAAEVEIARHGPETAIVARRVVIHGGRIDGALHRLEHQFLRGGASGPVSFVCDRITIMSSDAESQTLTGVRMVLETDEASRTFTADYRVAGVEMSSPARIRLARRPSPTGSATTHLHWRTGKAALAVAPWGGPFPWLVHLGSRCRFQGEFTAELAGGGWQGELHGVLTDIDLEQLISGQFPHKLSGPAEVAIRTARFANGELVEASGQFHGGPGVIGEPLLQSAVGQWQLKPRGGDSATEYDALQRYECLAFDFELNGSRLRIAGACPDAADGAILTIKDGRHWTTAAEHDPSAMSLVRVLVPDEAVNVPATSSTRRLIQWLPLPPPQLEETGDPPRAHARRG